MVVVAILMTSCNPSKIKKEWPPYISVSQGHRREGRNLEKVMEVFGCDSQKFRQSLCFISESGSMTFMNGSFLPTPGSHRRMRCIRIHTIKMIPDEYDDNNPLPAPSITEYLNVLIVEDTVVHIRSIRPPGTAREPLTASTWRDGARIGLPGHEIRFPAWLELSTVRSRVNWDTFWIIWMGIAIATVKTARVDRGRSCSETEVRANIGLGEFWGMRVMRRT